MHLHTLLWVRESACSSVLVTRRLFQIIPDVYEVPPPPHKYFRTTISQEGDTIFGVCVILVNKSHLQQIQSKGCRAVLDDHNDDDDDRSLEFFTRPLRGKQEARIRQE